VFECITFEAINLMFQIYLGLFHMSKNPVVSAAISLKNIVFSRNAQQFLLQEGHYQK